MAILEGDLARSEARIRHGPEVHRIGEGTECRPLTALGMGGIPELLRYLLNAEEGTRGYQLDRLQLRMEQPGRGGDG
jgi:hypothetical protein